MLKWQSRIVYASGIVGFTDIKEIWSLVASDKLD